ncbi:hypothetical protein [uncultured Limosilactobacillus sp.]|uniref:hypothetical protein n=1 Tax=uncultured Limosilactobacillus sp. TaxID=2837629 RepID=UPI0025995488|nr:hypothetical protein [uncultured Limosilactobacillus sp.]
MTKTEHQVEATSISIETLTGLAQTINDLVSEEQSLFTGSTAKKNLGFKLTALSSAIIEMAKKASRQNEAVTDALFKQYHSKGGEE